MNAISAWGGWAALLPMATFVFVSSITPGPNNVMLTASGANFGYQRTVPHMLGISAGAAIQLLLVGAGIGTVFAQVPQLFTAMQWMGAAYLLWLAWKMATSGHTAGVQAAAQPLNFWQAAAFQWVNPKAWLITLGVVSAYIQPSHYWSSLAVSVLLIMVVNYPCISVWTLFGTVIGRWLQSPKARRWFNWCMAGLLLLSMWPLLAGHA